MHPPPRARPVVAAHDYAMPGLTALVSSARPPEVRGFERVARLAILARAAGIDLVQDDHALCLALADLRDPSPAWSRGELGNDLFSPQLFGPRVDYRCECGKYTRMKDRGTVCEVCGVEVVQARVRGERFAHIRLAMPIAPRRFGGVTWAIVPVLPAGLRPDPQDALNQAYTRVLEAQDQAAVDAVVELMLGRLCEALAPRPLRADYSGAARVVIGTACRAPVELLARLASPLVFGLCESLGYTTTIKNAKQLIAGNPTVRRELVRMVMHERVLLVGARGPAMVGVAFEQRDDSVVELDRDTASQLGVVAGDRVSLHLPISDAGQYEAKQLAPRGAAPDVTTSWVGAVAESADRIGRLVEAARAGEVDPCTWPPAAVIIGGYRYDGPAPRPALGARPPVVRPAENEHLARHVDDLELSVRAANALEKAGITTIRELVQRSEAELLKMRCSRKSIVEIKEILAELRLHLGMAIDAR
ncbi:MAG: DNA-directed RNA polymerase subunit alpha C-terminal domain-containing protein [Kofleriaceae bacterium]